MRWQVLDCRLSSRTPRACGACCRDDRRSGDVGEPPAHRAALCARGACRRSGAPPAHRAALIAPQTRHEHGARCGDAPSGSVSAIDLVRIEPVRQPWLRGRSSRRGLRDWGDCVIGGCPTTLAARKVIQAGLRDWGVSDNPGCAEGHPGAGDMQHRQVVLNVLLPADEQPSEPVPPGGGAFDHPALFPPRTAITDIRPQGPGRCQRRCQRMGNE